jgi:hypothetical protein
MEDPNFTHNSVESNELAKFQIFLTGSSKFGNNDHWITELCNNKWIVERFV